MCAWLLGYYVHYMYLISHIAQCVLTLCISVNILLCMFWANVASVDVTSYCKARTFCGDDL